MSFPLFVFFALLIAKTGAELFLDILNRREVKRHSAAVPSAFRDSISSGEYQKSVNYTLTRNRFGMIETAYDGLILGILLGTGLLAWLFQMVATPLGDALWAQALTLFIVMILLSLPSLPFEWWSTFRIEAAFGFNKTTPRLWLTDKLKGLVLGLVLGFPVICLILAFFRWLPNTWWLWAWAAVFAFQILLLLLYPRFILPWFNKLSPLPEGSLRDRLLQLGERTGFTAKTIQVMDGSKRSTHSNAFFTGFGRFRNIVLFDTLVEQLEEEELEAVLAHEIGHYKKGHIPRILCLSAISLLIAFASLGWLAGQSWFYEAFGFSQGDGMAAALLLFSLLAGLVTFWFSPLFNILSRKHEYEADAFAKNAIGGEPGPMVRSLRKLNTKNLSNLTPHPAFSAFHYSHPTLLERERALLQNPAGGVAEG